MANTVEVYRVPPPMGALSVVSEPLQPLLLHELLDHSTATNSSAVVLDGDSSGPVGDSGMTAAELEAALSHRVGNSAAADIHWSLLPESYPGMRLGALSVLRWGEVVTDAPWHTADVIVPLGWMARRVFWSAKHYMRRCVYTCEVVRYAAALDEATAEDSALPQGEEEAAEEAAAIDIEGATPAAVSPDADVDMTAPATATATTPQQARLAAAAARKRPLFIITCDEDPSVMIQARSADGNSASVCLLCCVHCMAVHLTHTAVACVVAPSCSASTSGHDCQEDWRQAPCIHTGSY